MVPAMLVARVVVLAAILLLGLVAAVPVAKMELEKLVALQVQVPQVAEVVPMEAVLQLVLRGLEQLVAQVVQQQTEH